MVAKRIVAMSAKEEKEQSVVVRSDEGVAKRKTWKERERGKCLERNCDFKT